MSDYYDDETLNKVHEALRAAGVSHTVEAVSALQNAGILFRERQPENLSHVHAMPQSVYIDKLCEVMHDAYEKAAVGAGWETNSESRKPWSGVPEANKQTMRAAVTALREHLWVTEPTLEELAGRAYVIAEKSGFHEEWHEFGQIAKAAEGVGGKSRVELETMLRGMYLSQKLQLIGDEVSELHEHLRDGVKGIFLRCKSCGEDRNYYSEEYAVELREHAGRCAFARKDGEICGGELKPDGPDIEAADIQIRLWDTVGLARWDLFLAVMVKMAYNEKRPYKHGRAY